MENLKENTTKLVETFKSANNEDLKSVKKDLEDSIIQFEKMIDELK